MTEGDEYRVLMQDREETLSEHRRGLIFDDVQARPGLQHIVAKKAIKFKGVGHPTIE